MTMRWVVGFCFTVGLVVAPESRAAEVSSEAVVEESAAPANAGLGEVERKIDALAAEIERLRLGEVVPNATTPVYGLGPAASKVYQAQSGVTLGGYGEVLYQNSLGGDPTAPQDMVDFLRNVFYVGYKFDDKWVLNTEIEIEHVQEIYLEFAYLDYLYRPELNFRAGLLLVPMGITNELHEPTTFLAALRPETERRIIPSTWQENGAGVFGDAGPLSYRAYLLNGMNAAGFSSAGLRGGRQKGGKAAAEDFGGVLRLDFTGVDGLLAGVSAYYGGADQEQLDVQVNTLVAEAHVDVNIHGVSLRALYAQAHVQGARQLSTHLVGSGGSAVARQMQGWYVQAGYNVLASFDSSRTLTPYVRYEQIDTQHTMPRGFVADPTQDQEILTTGLAFYPVNQIVAKAEYSRWGGMTAGDLEAMNLLLGYIF